MDSLMSVTSSGLSSMRRTSRCISSYFLLICFAICLRRVVFPVLGGETIMPLCPLPIGARRLIILIGIGAPSPSSSILSLGKIGVISSKLLRAAMTAGSSSFTLATYKRALNFSPCVLFLILPVTISPVLRPNLLICAGDTYIS